MRPLRHLSPATRYRQNPLGPLSARPRLVSLARSRPAPRRIPAPRLGPSPRPARVRRSANPRTLAAWSQRARPAATFRAPAHPPRADPRRAARPTRARPASAPARLRPLPAYRSCCLLSQCPPALLGDRALSVARPRDRGWRTGVDLPRAARIPRPIRRGDGWPLAAMPAYRAWPVQRWLWARHRAKRTPLATRLLVRDRSPPLSRKSRWPPTPARAIAGRDESPHRAGAKPLFRRQIADRELYPHRAGGRQSPQHSAGIANALQRLDRIPPFPQRGPRARGQIPRPVVGSASCRE